MVAFLELEVPHTLLAGWLAGNDVLSKPTPLTSLPCLTSQLDPPVENSPAPSPLMALTSSSPCLASQLDPVENLVIDHAETWDQKPDDVSGAIKFFDSGFNPPGFD